MSSIRTHSNHCVDSGKMCLLEGPIKLGTTSIQKSWIDTAAGKGVTLTLLDEATDAVINGRNGSNIYDANGGTISDSGYLKLILDGDDNAPHGTLTKDAEQERRYVIKFWFKPDGTGVSKPGIEQGIYTIRKTAEPA